jgi:hypothetical protein
MIAILTQNKALVNIDNFETISVEDYEDNQKVIIVDSKYILGKYSLSEALEIITWIATSIGTHKEGNLIINMPWYTPIQESDNEETT